MYRIGLLVSLLAVAACHLKEASSPVVAGQEPKAGPDVVGTWVSQMFMGSESLDVPEIGPIFTITFKADGTFTGIYRMRGMVTADGKMKGTYVRTGAILTISGTNEMTMDDGYKKETNTLPFAMKLKIEKDRLNAIDASQPPTTIAFRREGTPPLAPPPPPKHPPSNPKATDIVRKMRAKYAAMKMYADEGTFRSGGKGFRAENATFRTRFSRDGRFLFRAEKIAGGKVYETSVVWSDGKKSWLYASDVGGYEERPIDNGLSILTVAVDSAATFVPSMLKLRGMDAPDINELTSLQLLKDGTTAGKSCYVIEGVRGELGKTKVWIEKGALLVRRTYDSFIECTADYSPRPEAKIAAQDFKFSPPK